MIFTIEPKEVADLRPTHILTQTRYWGRVKKQQGLIPNGYTLSVSSDLFDSSASSARKKSEDVLILLRYIDANHCFAYVPYGPKLEPLFENQGKLLEELSEGIRSQLPPECFFVRYDLSWKNQWSVEEEYYDRDGNWQGPPRHNVQEYRLNFNTLNGKLKKSAVDRLPKNTFFIDLTLSESMLWKGIRYTYRNAIHKSINEGIQVQEFSLEDLPIWYALYVQTSKRHKLDCMPLEFFSSILLKEDPEGGVRVKLLMAHKDYVFHSGLFLLISKHRATYLYGASADNKSIVGASHYLQWKSIQLAKSMGCTQYDFFGSAPNLNPEHPLHGVHIYKKGFGGELVHRMGCWDYPYHSGPYMAYRAQELQYG